MCVLYLHCYYWYINLFKLCPSAKHHVCVILALPSFLKRKAFNLRKLIANYSVMVLKNQSIFSIICSIQSSFLLQIKNIDNYCKSGCLM